MHKLLLLFAAILGCGNNPSYAYTESPLVVDAGTLTLASGDRIYGETPGETLPSLVASWEQLQPDVLRLGQGQGSASYRAVEVVQLDAADKVAVLLDGVSVLKIQDHPMVGGLMHLSGVPHLWFGNTLSEPADVTYQGTTSTLIADSNGVALAQPLIVRGQTVSGTSTATLVEGGDVEVRGGNTWAPAGVEHHPGDVIVGGGRIGYDARGNVALHDAPSNWCGLEGGVFVRDARTAPTSDPSNGGFLFSAGGALYWHGSSGTVTQIAAP